MEKRIIEFIISEPDKEEYSIKYEAQDKDLIEYSSFLNCNSLNIYNKIVNGKFTINQFIEDVKTNIKFISKLRYYIDSSIIVDDICYSKTITVKINNTTKILEFINVKE